MKILSILLLISTVSAFPGMQSLFSEIQRLQDSSQSSVLIGDLVNGATTNVGRQVRDCITGSGGCEDPGTKNYTVPGDLGSSSCTADICCVWDFIARELTGLFRNDDGTCSRLARASVRLGFHDAGAWSTTSGVGGADGSLILSDEEINRPENNGLQDVRALARRILNTYSSYHISAADLVQFMHNVATVVCPLGPRILTLVGRNDSSETNPPGLIPGNNVTDGEYLIQLFENKTFTPRDLGALVGAHSVGQQSFVDPSRANQSLDSTPGVWDVEFYSDVLSSSPPPGVFQLPSDLALSQTDGTSSRYRAFADRTFGQTVWNDEYSAAYVRLSLLGVNNINQLTDCTKVLPDAITSFSAPSSTSSGPASTSSVSISSKSVPRTIFSLSLVWALFSFLG